MSGTVYPILARPRADAETLKRLYSAKENKTGEGYTETDRLLDSITRDYGWKPALEEPVLGSDSIWGYRQKEVVRYRMPDGHEYNVLVSYVQDYGTGSDTDEPEVILYDRKDAPDGFTLLGYEPQGDTLVITYGEEKDVYQFEGYTLGVTTVATVDPKDRWCLLGKVPYVEKLYLGAFIGEECPFQAVEFRKVVAVPDECFGTDAE